MFGRCLFAFVSLPLAHDTPAIFMTLMMFCIVESIRYPYYYLKSNGKENTTIGRFYGWLRYNTFIVCYPIGAIGEVLVGFAALPEIRSTSPKRFSIEMPNDWNFAFDMEYLIKLLPLIYIAGFPMNYLYLLGQRKRYF
jgi:very-long-chain (3R)-3-hydroxyacyl-CoA dehydratase